jgi:hypothetical protein
VNSQELPSTRELHARLKSDPLGRDLELAEADSQPIRVGLIFGSSRSQDP